MCASIYCLLCNWILNSISPSHILAIFVLTANNAKYKCFAVSLCQKEQMCLIGQIRCLQPKMIQTENTTEWLWNHQYQLYIYICFQNKTIPQNLYSSFTSFNSKWIIINVYTISICVNVFTNTNTKPMSELVFCRDDRIISNCPWMKSPEIQESWILNPWTSMFSG